MRYLSDRQPNCVVTHPPIDNHPHHSFAGHTLLTALALCIEQGTIAPDISILLTGTSQEHGYADAADLITLHTSQEAFAKAEGFTRIYRTQALRRPEQYEREILARDAASGRRGVAQFPNHPGGWYGEEMSLAHLTRYE